RFAAHRALPGHADADPDAQKLERQRDRVGAERAAERNRNELVAVDDEHATVVIVDQGPELGRDLVPDSVHVGEAVVLAALALQHLHVCERTDVAQPGGGVGPLGRVRLVQDDAVLALGFRRHHRGLCAGGELARVHSCSGPSARPMETVTLPTPGGSSSPRRSAIREATCDAWRPSQALMMTPSSSPPSRQTMSSGRTAPRTVSARSLIISSPIPWPCTSFTRLKSSMSSMSTATGLCVMLASCSAPRSRSWKLRWLKSPVSESVCA